MDLGLNGKVVVITGAGSGIGRNMAIHFAHEGAIAVVNDVDEAGASETATLIRNAGGSSFVQCFDVSDLERTRRGFLAIEQACGPVGVLVNNAGLMRAGPFLESKPEDWELEIRVNLFGTLNCTRCVLPGMVDRRYGKIVNIVSEAARVGQERESTYACSKGAVISFTKSVAREVGRHNVNVNAVSPAATDTPLRQALLRDMAARMGEEAVAERERKVRRAYPLRRIGESDDVSAVALFLASERARHMTGQVVGVNGGYTMIG